MKKELRQTVLNQMKKLTGKEKEQADSWLTQHLLSSAAYQKLRLSLPIFLCRMKSQLQPLSSRLSWTARGF